MRQHVIDIIYTDKKHCLAAGSPGCVYHTLRHPSSGLQKVANQRLKAYLLHAKRTHIAT